MPCNQCLQTKHNEMKKTLLILLLLCAQCVLMAQPGNPGGDPNGICTGILRLSSQAEVDAFTCSSFHGELRISGEDITNLDALSSLTYVEGILDISGNPNLISLTGLENLTTIDGDLDGGGGGLFIFANQSLSSLAGLENLSAINGPYASLSIGENPILQTLTPLQALEGFVSIVQVQNNEQLVNLNGLEGITSSFGINVYDNPALVDIDGLIGLSTVDLVYLFGNDALQSIDGLSSMSGSTYALDMDIKNVAQLPAWTELDTVFYLSISNSQISSMTNLASTTILEGLDIINNDALVSLKGMGAISEGASVSIRGNAVLEGCCILKDLNIGERGYIRISNNAPGCNTLDEVAAVCKDAPSLPSRRLRVTAEGRSAAITWVNGDGDGRIVVMKAIGTANFFPVDGVAYDQDPHFGDYTVGNGNSIVYNYNFAQVEDEEVLVSQLQPNTLYQVRIFDYNDGVDGPVYNTSAYNTLIFRTPEVEPLLLSQNPVIGESILSFEDSGVFGDIYVEIVGADNSVGPQVRGYGGSVQLFREYFRKPGLYIAKVTVNGAFVGTVRFAVQQ